MEELIQKCGGDNIYLDINVNGQTNEARKIFMGPTTDAEIMYGKGATILEALNNLYEALKEKGYVE